MNDNISRIRPEKGWQSLNFADVWEYRDLLYFLTLRGIKSKYAQSVLGIGWAIINPLIQTIIFTVIFGNLVALASDGVPYLIFNFTAMVAWTYFSGILMDATSSLIENRAMIGKVYFPRLILPLAAVFSKLLDFVVGLLVLIALLFYYQIVPGFSVLLFPLFLLILLLTGIGLGSFLAALAVQYRDINYAMSLVIRVLMYAAPVVYSVDVIPERWQAVYALNPMVGVIEGMRAIFLQTRPVPWDWIGIGGAVSVVIFMFGCLYFRRTERSFADIA